MSYQSERDCFLHEMGRRYPGAGISAAIKLLRHATAAQRWNEIDCSINISDGERERCERRAESRRAAVESIASGMGASVEFNGDPRGHPFCLTDGEGRRLSVPGRGLPARCFR